MEQAAELVPTGPSTLAIGGNSLHRTPLSFVHALARRGNAKLHIVKTAGAYDIDVLCLAGLVEAVSAGFVGYETQFGLARHYRRAVETGRVEAREHACYTVITSLRASVYGMSFLPVRGLDGSDLVAARGFARVENPYDHSDTAVAIPAITPDVAVIHVQYADPFGNGVIMGPKYEDVVMARAAKKVILITERMVGHGQLPVPMDHVDVPSVLVDALVEAPGGAWPGSCYGEYDLDEAAVQRVIDMQSGEELQEYLAELDRLGSRSGGTSSAEGASP